MYTSWCRVLWDFVFDPAIGPYARIRRKIDLTGNKKLDEKIATHNAKIANGHSTTGLANGECAAVTNGVALARGGI